MSAERRPGRYTLEDIVNLAREIILKDGVHLPTVIAQGSTGSVVSQFPDLPDTHEARAQMMYVVGMAFARSGKVGVLQQVFAVTEGWLSVPDEDGEVIVPPSQDPNRVEVLVVTRYQVEGDRTDLALHEMIRERGGRLVDLKPFEHPETDAGGQADSPLVDAFVSGFRSQVGGRHN